MVDSEWDDDLFPSFAAVEVDDFKTAKAARIAQFRKDAFGGYTAKIEEPLWFKEVDSPSEQPKGTVRHEKFALQHKYFTGKYKEAAEQALEMIRSDNLAKPEEVELLDIYIRSCLKGKNLSKDTLELARRYKKFEASDPSYSYIAAQVFYEAPRAQVAPLEALEAVLSAITRRSSSEPYRELLANCLNQSGEDDLGKSITDFSYRIRIGHEEVERRINKLDLTETAKKALRKILSTRPQEGDEDDAAPLRDVRSL